MVLFSISQATALDIKAAQSLECELQSLGVRGWVGPPLRTLGMYHFDVVGQRFLLTVKRPNALQRTGQMESDDS